MELNPPNWATGWVARFEGLFLAIGEYWNLAIYGINTGSACCADPAILVAHEFRSFYDSVRGLEFLRGVFGPVGLAHLAVGQGTG